MLSRILRRPLITAALAAFGVIAVFAAGEAVAGGPGYSRHDDHGHGARVLSVTPYAKPLFGLFFGYPSRTVRIWSYSAPRHHHPVWHVHRTPYRFGEVHRRAAPGHRFGGHRFTRHHWKKGHRR